MKMYICPMHKEVQQDKPGTCPKCGMRLVETKKEMNHGDHVMKNTSKKNFKHGSSYCRWNHRRLRI